MSDIPKSGFEKFLEEQLLQEKISRLQKEIDEDERLQAESVARDKSNKDNTSRKLLHQDPKRIMPSRKRNVPLPPDENLRPDGSRVSTKYSNNLDTSSD